jgi:hypothetical protein
MFCHAVSPLYTTEYDFLRCMVHGETKADSAVPRFLGGPVGSGLRLRTTNSCGPPVLKIR